MATSCTYSSVPVRWARTRLVSRMRSGVSGVDGTMAPQGVGERLHMIGERDDRLVGPGMDAAGAVRFVIRHLCEIPAVGIGEVHRVEEFTAKGLRPIPRQRPLHFEVQL